MLHKESQEIRAICLRLLARREHSRKELTNKLTAKGYSGDCAQNIISELAGQGLQSDSRFSESYTRQRIQKGYGPIRINYELQQKGIDDCNFDAIVEASAGTWADLLTEVYCRKYEEARQLTPQEWAKRSRFLQQRGFSSEMVMNLFKQLDVRIK